MSTDPMADMYANQPPLSPDEEERAARRRKNWTTCLVGCLVVLGVMLVLATVVGVWLARNWRNLFADIGSQAINQGIDSSDLPPQEKVEVKVQVDRVAKAFREGRISNERAIAIAKKVMQSPLMPTLVVAAVDAHYFNRSGLSDQEKAEGRKTLKRFARGVIDGKIDQKGIDAVLSHVAERRGENNWQFRQQVSDQDLRAALDEAKSRADAANIPSEPENIDPSDEMKKIIDEALQEK